MVLRVGHNRRSFVLVGGLVVAVIAGFRNPFQMESLVSQFQPVVEVNDQPHIHLVSGKSCSFRNSVWDCQQCTDDGKCSKLSRRRLCPQPSPIRGPSVEVHRNGDRTMNIRQKTFYHNQPDCTLETCWDFNKCTSVGNLTIYVHGSKSDYLVDYAIEHSRYPLQRVNDHRQACLVIVFPNTYKKFELLRSSEHWKSDTTSGQNHLLWEYSRFTYYPRLTSDNAFQLFPIGSAAVASESLDKGFLRQGFDMSLALSTPGLKNRTSVHNRPYLLQFRGTIQSTQHIGYHHRWLAAEYWEKDEAVKVDVQCVEKNWMQPESRTLRDYAYSPELYHEWINNAIFGFAPGGSGPGSYRFVEILHAGGIPVVTDNFVPPLYPEVEWNDCLVIVPEERIVDLPRLLRLYSADQIQRRQDACGRLLQGVIGVDNGATDSRVMLTRALEIWALRISSAKKLASFDVPS